MPAHPLHELFCTIECAGQLTVNRTGRIRVATKVHS
jgi:hypothetical protein